VVIAPRAVLSGHPHHQVLDLFVDAGTATRLARLGGIHLLVGEFAVPRQDGIGRGNGGNLFQCLLAQLRTNLGKLLTFWKHTVSYCYLRVFLAIMGPSLLDIASKRDSSDGTHVHAGACYLLVN
jgi:hypothetical protein